ncbi:hypothetical protein KW805_01240 [Candidatus Pacearchaeota archaeon]|nr:hypothetical protein [Candidatus Pacearchaeota archaeon]
MTFDDVGEGDSHSGCLPKVLVLVGLGAFGATLYWGGREQNKYSDTIQRVRQIAAGEDNVWTTQEKKEFLKELRIKDTLIEGQDIRFWKTGDETEIISQYNLRDDGKIIYGKPMSATVLGTVANSQLEKYIADHKK